MAELIDDSLEIPPTPLPEPEDEAPEVSPYLRRQKRVEVRRSLSRSMLRRSGGAAAVVLLLAGLGYGGYRLVRYGLYNERFLLRPERIEVGGTRYVTRAQVLERFAGDVGRSVLAIPLEQRRVMLEQLPWVEAVELLRLWPNRIRVVVRERTPVAFARAAAGLVLVDPAGVLLDRPRQVAFSFPVVTGISENDAPDDRRHRMGLFNSLMQDLDREGNRYSLDISEVDLSDPEDARLTLADPAGAGALVVHLGNASFLDRYKTYLAHVQEWRREHPEIRSIDLRYHRQVVLTRDTK